jgi:vacuolar-type H+-ATPase subunit H
VKSELHAASQPLALLRGVTSASQSTPAIAASTVEAAIERVLAAERDAHGAVDRAAQDAAAIVDAARGAARTIAARTGQRVQLLRERFAACVADEVAALERESAEQDTVHALSPADLGRLQRAIVALCAELTAGPR